jgi:hypothetical protein
MLTLGVDFAAQPKNTAVCIIDWSSPRARVTKLKCKVADDEIRADLLGVDKAGFDVPLGWPLSFTEAIQAHSKHKPWTTATVRRLRFRATDLYVHSKTDRWPLSVSTDRIAIASFRAASLFSKLGEALRRCGDGKIVEVYPAAALRIWGFCPTGYKGSKGKTKRCGLLTSFLDRTGSWLDVPDVDDQLCRTSDNALDALIASLVARASALGLTDPVPSGTQADADIEGWIALPTPDSFGSLVDADACATTTA